MAKRKKYYQPFGVISTWDSLQAAGVPIKGAASVGIGFIPVYDSLEEFKKHYPDLEPRVLLGPKPKKAKLRMPFCY